MDPAWPASGPERAGPTAGDLLTTVLDVLIAPHVGLALLLGGMVLVAARRVTPSGGTSGTVRRAEHIYLLAVGSTVMLLAVLGVLWWNLGEISLFPRFWMPLIVATALFPMAVVNVSTAVGGRARVLGVGAFAAAATVVTLGAASHADVRDFVPDMASGRSLQQVDADRYGNVEADYDEVSSMIEPGSTVLTAVDVPSLLLGHDFDVHTLDLLGSTSPPPRLPYFEGARGEASLGA